LENIYLKTVGVALPRIKVGWNFPVDSTHYCLASTEENFCQQLF